MLEQSISEKTQGAPVNNMDEDVKEEMDQKLNKDDLRRNAEN